MARPTAYSRQIHQSIVAAIRAGSFGWVAAESSGISRATFNRWLHLGQQKKREPYRSFAFDVRQARAQARLAAELEVRREQPFNWLRFGPGRERDNEPGWTESLAVKHSGSVDVVHSPEWAAIAGAIQTALDPYPEARLAVAEALEKLATPPTDDAPRLPLASGSTDRTDVP